MLINTNNNSVYNIFFILYKSQPSIRIFLNSKMLNHQGSAHDDVSTEWFGIEKQQ